MNLRSFNSVFIGISHSYVSTYFVKADATGVELLETISKFGKRKKISSVLVYVIHKTRNFHVVIVQKRQRNAQ